jgi:hypothetical protein
MTKLYTRDTADVATAELEPNHGSRHANPTTPRDSYGLIH